MLCFRHLVVSWLHCCCWLLVASIWTGLSCGLWGRRRRGRQRMRWPDGITDSMGMSLSKFPEFVMNRDAWRAAIHGVAKSRTWLSNWTDWLTDFLWIGSNLRFHTDWSLSPALSSHTCSFLLFLQSEIFTTQRVCLDFLKCHNQIVFHPYNKTFYRHV